jgi:hypothetical protein
MGLATALLGLLILVFAALHRSSNKPSLLASLTLADGDLEIGNVWSQQNYEHVLHLKNCSNSTIRVESIGSSCACSVVQDSSFEIDPDRNVSIPIVLDLRPKLIGSSLAPTFPFSTTIVAIANNGLDREPITWRIHGRVQTSFDLTPPVLDFGSSLVRGAGRVVKKVKLTPYQPVRDIHSHCASDAISVVIEQGRDGSYDILVAACDQIVGTPGSFDVSLSAVLLSGETLPSIILPVTAQVIERIGFTPAHLHFGAIDVGRSCKRTVSLRSTLGQHCQLSTVLYETGNGVAINYAPDSHIGSDLCEVTFIQTALHEGEQSHSVVFVFREDVEEYRVRYQIGYYGTFSKSSLGQ